MNKKFNYILFTIFLFLINLVFLFLFKPIYGEEEYKREELHFLGSENGRGSKATSGNIRIYDVKEDTFKFDITVNFNGKYGDEPCRELKILLLESYEKDEDNKKIFNEYPAVAVFEDLHRYQKFFSNPQKTKITRKLEPEIHKSKNGEYTLVQENIKVRIVDKTKKLRIVVYYYSDFRTWAIFYEYYQYRAFINDLDLVKPDISFRNFKKFDKYTFINPNTIMTLSDNIELKRYTIYNNSDTNYSEPLYTKYFNSKNEKISLFSINALNSGIYKIVLEDKANNKHYYNNIVMQRNKTNIVVKTFIHNTTINNLDITNKEVYISLDDSIIRYFKENYGSNYLANYLSNFNIEIKKDEQKLEGYNKDKIYLNNKALYYEDNVFEKHFERKSVIKEYLINKYKNSIKEIKYFYEKHKDIEIEKYDTTIAKENKKAYLYKNKIYFNYNNLINKIQNDAETNIVTKNFVVIKEDGSYDILVTNLSDRVSTINFKIKISKPLISFDSEIKHINGKYYILNPFNVSLNHAFKNNLFIKSFSYKFIGSENITSNFININTDNKDSKFYVEDEGEYIFRAEDLVGNVEEKI